MDGSDVILQAELLRKAGRRMANDTSDLDEVWPQWKEAVNMSASQL